MKRPILGREVVLFRIVQNSIFDSIVIKLII
jgi:hypothetical protein